MSKKVSPVCPVCKNPYTDHLRLPLSTTCGHTSCATCLRSHTLKSCPNEAPPREGQVPTGKEIQCLQCQKVVNTDELVIDRAALAKVPLSLDDLVIADDPATTPRPAPYRSQTKTTSKTSWDHDSTTQENVATAPQTQLDPTLGWSIPPQPLEMDPHHPPHPPPSQPGVVGWAVSSPHHPTHPPSAHPPHQMPLPPDAHALHHQHHDPHQQHGHHAPYPAHHSTGHGHHGHGSTIAAGAAGVAAGVGVTALATSHKKKKKKDKKHKKEKKKGKEKRHRSSSSSSSGSSSSSRSSHSS